MNAMTGSFISFGISLYDTRHRRGAGYRFVGSDVSIEANSSGISRRWNDAGVGGVGTRVRDVNPDHRPWRWSSQPGSPVARIPRAGLLREITAENTRRTRFASALLGPKRDSSQPASLVFPVKEIVKGFHAS
ncbi:hypothetical protein DMN91_004552 [Ooceraea biroi]|uniref:Uncharacterized protein n=1 Tax=Ooceraea biroi TaxID=2015173 RepID=A0A3L8DPB3_OOCBI|nr:hypothetical protein DMN91_004552 [Ooceraea biroi]